MFKQRVYGVRGRFVLRVILGIGVVVGAFLFFALVAAATGHTSD